MTREKLLKQLLVKTRFTFLLTIYLLPKNLSAQSYTWAFQCGHSDSFTCLPAGLGTDSANNVYLCGSTYCPSDFDPMGTSLTFTTVQSQYNTGFLAKYDQNMNVVWGFNLNNPGSYGTSGHNNCFHDLQVENNGDVYVTLFNQQGGSPYMDLDPGPGVASFSAGNYLVKYSSSGNFVWATSIGFSNTSGPLDMPHLHLDKFGHLYLYSRLDNSVSCFDTSGNSIFSKSFGSYSYFTNLTTDLSGNILVAGTFYSDSIDVDWNSGVVNLYNPTGYESIFIAKYDSTGNYLYSNTAHCKDNIDINNMLLNQQGDLYLNGVYTDSVDFSPGTNGALMISDIFNHYFMFTVKYDLSLNYVWGFPVGPGVGGGMRLDASNNLMLGGSVSYNNVDFDPGSGVVHLPFGTQAYIAYYTQDSVLINLDGASSKFPPAVNSRFVFGKQNDFYVCGLFSGTIFLDSNNTQTLTTLSSSPEIFLGRYGYTPPLGLNDLSDNSFLKIYPNPSSDATFAIELADKHYGTGIKIYDMPGKLIYYNRDWFEGLKIINLEVGSGVYFINLITNEGNLYKKIMITGIK